MKAERLIRAYRDDLRELGRGPCPVCGEVHDEGSMACDLGQLMMFAVERALSWALDEQPEDDHLIERIAEAAAKVRAHRRAKKGGTRR